MRSDADPTLSRRRLLELSGLGFGSLALACLLGEAGEAGAAEAGPASRPPHRRPKARAVIQLVQNGGPSQMDLFDPKPELSRRSGQKCPSSVETFQKGSEANTLLGSPFRFHPRGRCGMELSEVLPHLGGVADELCLVRSMYTEHNNHTEALVMLQTGKIFAGRPTLGAWVSYALGTENGSLPAYVVLRDPAGYNTSGSLLWEHGWLPPLHRGTEFASAGDAVLNLRPSRPEPDGVRRDSLEYLARLNEEHRRRFPREAELEARIRNYELAARMQLAAGRVTDLAAEPESAKRMYGLDDPVTAGYGARCLLARRLVEHGVRFVQVFPPVKPQFQPWDSHSNTKDEIARISAMTDLPSAALVRDLKQRGLLDDTVVLWSGEFGRLPISQNGSGRDHNRNAFSLFLAGGGFAAGRVHGQTDELGYRAAVDRVSVPDLHATLLHVLGLDHRRVSYPHHGREETLTDAPATGAGVVEALLA